METALAVATDDAASAAAVHIVAATVGFASTILLWLSILVGIVLSRSWALSWIKHTTIKTAHMSLAITGLALGVVHALAQLAAPGTYVRWVDQVVPFINPEKPIGVGLGTVALEMMLALALSVPIQRRLGHARWKMIHSTAYMAYTVTAAHLLFTGTEVVGWVVWAVVASWFVTTGLWIAMSPKFGRQLSAAGAGIMEKRAAETTVNVNPHVCARFGFCEHEAPDIFQLRGTGRLAYRTTVEPHEVDALHRAVRVCPARAITMQGPGVALDFLTPPVPGPDGASLAGVPTSGGPQTQETRSIAPVSPPPAPGPANPAGPTPGPGAPHSPVGAGAPRPTARLGPFPPGGPGRRHGQPVDVPPAPPTLRAVPNRSETTGSFEKPDLSRYDNVTGLRPRGGNR